MLEYGDLGEYSKTCNPNSVFFFGGATHGKNLLTSPGAVGKSPLWHRGQSGQIRPSL